MHNVYQSSHSNKNYYTTTQNGINILNINHEIRMAGKNDYNKFLISNWYFEPRAVNYTFLSPDKFNL